MILKVKGWEDNDWQVLDGINNIHYDYTTRGHLKNPDSGKIDMWIDGQEKTLRPASDRFIKCILHRTDGEYVIVFESFAYLCNDSGQTIEKLIP